jgi:DNA-directed RNA polymerase specialized sigma24 family protein
VNQTGVSFTRTRWSQIALASGATPEARTALDWLCRAYWDPLHAHAARRGWRDADDAVQDFWVAMLERGSLIQADQTRGRFRTWLLACLDNHLADRHRACQALKRGGGHDPIALLEDKGGSISSGQESPDANFDRIWAITLLARARQRLAHGASGEAQRRSARLARFLDNNGDAEAYIGAAAELGLSEGAVKVAVHRLRLRFRDCLRAEVAETLVDPTPAMIDAELSDLLSALGQNP